jgi:signal transduction histidine kinase
MAGSSLTLRSRSEPGAEKQAVAIPGAPAAAREERKPRVLVADDNPDIVRVIQRILSAEGYELTTAANGEEALALARAWRPDVIILDVMMPKLNGLEVCRELKDDPVTLSTMVILVTGRGSPDHLVEGFDAGADDYIPKPFHIHELTSRTRCALRIKRLTDDLAEQNRLLQERGAQLVQREKMATIGLLASGIAHEFNNIMAGLCGYAQLARKIPEFKEKLVDVAMTQTQRALELTRSLSTYNRANVDRPHSRVGEVVDEALCLVARELQKAGVTLTKDVDRELCVRMSPGQLQEIILNLAINAIQAMETVPDRTGVLEVRAFPADRDPSVVHIEVRDNGGGVRPEHLPRIFDPFFTTKGALGGGSRSGTGLGLTVCYNIVHAHSGEIEAVSDLGRGTTFTVRLPRSFEAPDRREEPLREPPPTLRTLRILVLDDDPLVQETMRAFLAGQEVVCLPRVRDALHAHVERPFDFVILDICLKGSLNGFQAFDLFSQAEKPPRVIFASGGFPDGAYKEYLRRAHGHLLKPFQLEDLAHLLGLRAPWPAAMVDA